MIAPRWAALMAVCLILSACHAASDGHAPGNIVVGGRVDAQAWTALSKQLDRMPAAEQRTMAAERDRQLERQLWTLGGMDTALGGTAQADSVFDHLHALLSEQLKAATSKPMTLKPASLVRASEPAAAALYAGGLASFLQSRLSVEATNDGRTGAYTSDRFRLDVGKNSVGVEATQTVDYQGTSVTVKTTSDVQPCPDPNGQVEADGTVDVLTSAPGGGAGLHATVDVHARADVTDDAGLRTVDVSYQVQLSRVNGPSGEFVDVSRGFTGQPRFNRSGGSVSDAFRSDAVQVGEILVRLVGTGLLSAAKDGWESGRCVELKPTVSAGPTGLKPGAAVTINAAPRSKIDGAKTGGTVSATLTAGAASVAPSGTKVRADATFTYTAPGEKDKTGTVALEARSKRGVAKATIDFDTRSGGWLAVGGQGDFHGTGTICDLDKPFEISGSGLTMSFTPSGAAAGQWTLTGSAGGASWSGNGSYTVELKADGSGGWLHATGANVVHSPVGSFGGVTNIVYRLSPTSCG